MYCPNCGKELKDISAKFCPECGSSIGAKTVQKTAPSQPEATKFNLRKAMLIICVLFAACTIILFIAAEADAGPSGYDGDLHYWFSEGGSFVCIGMGLISVIAGIIGLCSKK